MKRSETQARSVSQPRNYPPFAKLCEGGRRCGAGRNNWLAADVPRPAAARRFRLGCDQLQSVENHRLYSGCSDIDSQEHEQDPNRKCLSRQNMQHAGIPNRNRSLEIARVG